jgi:hypothetical protein
LLRLEEPLRLRPRELVGLEELLQQREPLWLEELLGLEELLWLEELPRLWRAKFWLWYAEPLRLWL